MSNYTIPVEGVGPVFSYHAFLFPFSWSYKGMEDRLFEEQIDLKRIITMMNQQASRWQRKDDWLDTKTVPAYNETAYFYEFVRPVLYDTGKADSLQAHYQLVLPKDEVTEYIIETPLKISYRLEVDDITVSFYGNGVGIVAFHLLNKAPKQSTPQDILNINFFGRRLYPPYLSTLIPEVGTDKFFNDNDYKRGLDDMIANDKELARSIRIVTGDNALATDDFTSWEKVPNLNRPPELIADLLRYNLQSTITIKPVLDERTYTVCWYGNSEMIKSIQGKPSVITPEADTDNSGDKLKKAPPTIDHNTHYQTHDWWYKLIFVDQKYKSVGHPGFMANLVRRATYERWLEDGTLYGASRYSFVVLTGEPELRNEEELKLINKEREKEGLSKIWPSPFPAIFLTHAQTMYHKLAILCLVQRAGLLRFSQEITNISKLDTTKGSIAKRIGSLYKEYLKFINKIYFREVSAQEQGIELYNLMQEQMGLPAQVTALQQEMQELHQYATIVEEDARNEKLDLLTYVAALFVVPGFIGGYFGIADYDLSEQWGWISLFCLVSAALAFGSIKAQPQYRNYWFIALAAFMLFVIFLFPMRAGIWD